MVVAVTPPWLSVLCTGMCVRAYVRASGCASVRACVCGAGRVGRDHKTSIAYIYVLQSLCTCPHVVAQNWRCTFPSILGQNETKTLYKPPPVLAERNREKLGKKDRKIGSKSSEVDQK